MESPELTIYEKYANIKNHISDLKKIEDELKKEIINDMNEKGESSIKNDLGSYSFSKRKTFVFDDPRVDEAKDALTQAQDTAREEELFTVKESQVLTFKPVK